MMYRLGCLRGSYRPLLDEEGERAGWIALDEGPALMPPRSRREWEALGAIFDEDEDE